MTRASQKGAKMVSSKRSLLIVEDDQFLNAMYRLYCEEVLKEFPHLDCLVEQAFTYEQARKILQSQPLQFVSMDIALTHDEEGKTEEERLEHEVGGMTLLKYLDETHQQPLVVIVSGEKLQSYAIDAYQEYGVLAFYQKDRFDDEAYKLVVRTALLYADAAELIEALEVDAALAAWHQAQQAARQAGIKERNFENLGHKIQRIRDSMTHPMTGLPLGRWTEDRLRRNVIGQEDNWALVHVTIKDFNRFVALFPSQEGPILDFVAGLLKQTRVQFQDDTMFIGHLGHRELFLEPTFVMVLGKPSRQRAGEIADWLTHKFAETGSRPFARDPSLEGARRAEEPEFSLELRLLPAGDNTYFPDLPLLLDTLGAIKPYPAKL